MKYENPCGLLHLLFKCYVENTLPILFFPLMNILVDVCQIEAFFTRSFHLAKKFLFMKSLLGVSEEPFLAATFASFQCLGGSRYIGREGKGMPHERFKPVHDFFLTGGLTFLLGLYICDFNNQGTSSMDFIGMYIIITCAALLRFR